MNSCEFKHINQQVKKWNGLLMLSTTLVILSIMLSGFNNSESAIDVAKHQVEI